jgi:hypothetical protein
MHAGELAPAGAQRKRKLALLVGDAEGQQSPHPRERQPIRGVADEPGRDAAPAQVLGDVQLPDVAPAGQARERAADCQVGLQLDHPGHAVAKHGDEARRVV